MTASGRYEAFETIYSIHVSKIIAAFNRSETSQDVCRLGRCNRRGRYKSKAAPSLKKERPSSDSLAVTARHDTVERFIGFNPTGAGAGYSDFD